MNTCLLQFLPCLIFEPLRSSGLPLFSFAELYMLSCKDINKYESLISAHNFASQEAPPGGAPATSNFASSGGWTDLPSDLLGRILQLLELLEALAAAAVCTSWCSAAAAAGVPRGLTPWLISWKPGNCRSSEFRNLIGTRETHKVSLPTGRRNPEWCGASHGWLVASDELSKSELQKTLTLQTGLQKPHIRNYAKKH